MRFLIILRHKVQNYCAMNRREQRLFWRAAFELTRFNLRLRYVRFAELLKTERLVPSQESPSTLSAGHSEICRAIRIAVARAARALPFANRCLVRSLAEMSMLNSEHLAAELCIGFRRNSLGRTAGHAWVNYADHTNASALSFSIAARYRQESTRPG